VPSSDSIYGRVFKADGVTPAANALVYVWVLQNDTSGNGGESALLSGMTDGNGYWIDAKTGGALNLAAVRTRDGAGYFSYSPSGDAVRIRADSGSDCGGLIQVDTANDAPAPAITLSCLAMMNLDISNGWDVMVLAVPPAGGSGAEWLLDEIGSQGGNGLEMARWLPASGNWSGHLHNLPFGNFDVQPETPYFLHGATRSLLRLQPGVGPMQSEAITLTTGWNFIALPGLSGALSAHAACAQIAAQGGAAVEIDRWDAEASNWAAHVCGLPFGDFCMTPGKGYFIRAATNSVWTPQGSATCSAAAASSAASGLAAAVGQPVISAVRIANVRDGSFAVSWLTDLPATGQVRYGSDPSALVNVTHDDRGASAVGRTHHVTVRGLRPETIYYVALVSGEIASGDLYRITTGPTLGIPAAHTAYGRIVQADGVTPAAGALVYLTLFDRDDRATAGQAERLSTLTDANGYWAVNLGAARAKYGDAYFVYGGDDGLALETWYGPAVQAGQTLAVGQAAPAPPLVLGGGMKVYLPLVKER